MADLRLRATLRDDASRGLQTLAQRGEQAFANLGRRVALGLAAATTATIAAANASVRYGDEIAKQARQVGFGNGCVSILNAGGA